MLYYMSKKDEKQYIVNTTSFYCITLHKQRKVLSENIIEKKKPFNKLENKDITYNISHFIVVLQTKVARS